MGAYLSQPITKKESSDHEGSNLSCGASSMQGWRIYQEDAHNVIIDFDENKSLFAVYDGHGGSEVAFYTSKHLPRFIKNTEEFKKGNYKQALINAFMEFDENLIKDEVMAILKDLKKENEGEDSYPATDEDALVDDDDGDNVNNLYEEATMPLSEVISRYRNPGIQRLKESGEKPMSPRLKSKDKKSNEETGEGCSSSSSTSAGSSGFVGSSSSCAPASSSSSPTSSKVNKADAASLSNSSAEATPAISTEPASIPSKAKSSSPSKPEPSSASSAQPTPTACSEASSTSLAKDEKEANGPAASGVNSSNSESNSGSEEKKKENGEMNGGKTSEEEAVISSSDLKPFKGKAKDKPVVVTNGDSEADSSAHALSNGKSQRTSPRKTLGTKHLLDHTMSDDSSESDEDFLVDEDVQGSSSDSDEGDEHTVAASRNLPDMDSDEEDDEDEELEEEEEDSDEDDSDYEEGEGGALSPEDLQKRMKEALDHKDIPGMDSGCTAVVVLFVDNQIYIANAGDSRAVLCRGTTALDLSEDHKPEDEVERARIVKAGGEVTPDGRVNGGLNLSRALGDHSYKQTSSLPLSEQMITALPDVTVQSLQPDDKFIVIACDGIWNSLSSQEVVDFVRERIEKPEKKLSVICEELFDKCLAPDSLGDGTGCDNMTCVLVRLHGNRGPVESHAHSATAASKRTREEAEEEEAEAKPSAKKTKTDEAAEAVAKITEESKADGEPMSVESSGDTKSTESSAEEVGSST